MRLLLLGLWWQKVGARMALVLISLATFTLLGGCWEVAGPLIGVGAAGGGAAVAVRGVGTKPGSSPTAIQQVGGASAVPVARSTEPQLLDLASEPVAAGLPTSTRAASTSPTFAVGEVSRKVPAGRRKGKVVVQSSKPKRPTGTGSVAIASPFSAPPDVLPATVIVH